MISKVFFSSISIMLFIACKKPVETTQQNLDRTDVYVAGAAYNNVSNPSACYWKNEEVINLGTSTTNSWANDIAVINNDVYVIGTRENSDGTNQRGIIWKNGVVKVLTDNECYPLSITVHNNIAYVVGYTRDLNDNDRAFIWNSGTETVSYLSTNSSSANSVKYITNDQIIVGYVNSKATIWTNGIPQSIDDPGYTTSNFWNIVKNGTFYYTIGTRGNLGAFSEYGYWKINNQTSEFTKSATLGIATFSDLKSKNDTLFIVGQKGNNGFNATLLKVNLQNNTNNIIELFQGTSNATDIQLDNDNTYIAINDYSGITNKALYWKNGVIKTLPKPTGFNNVEPSRLFIHKR